MCVNGNHTNDLMNIGSGFVYIVREKDCLYISISVVSIYADTSK